MHVAALIIARCSAVAEDDIVLYDGRVEQNFEFAYVVLEGADDVDKLIEANYKEQPKLDGQKLKVRWNHFKQRVRSSIVL